MSEMLQDGRIHLNEPESEAVAAFGDGVVGFTREGPLLHVMVGSDEYEVAEDGTTVKRDG